MTHAAEHAKEQEQANHATNESAAPTPDAAATKPAKVKKTAEEKAAEKAEKEQKKADEKAAKEKAKLEAEAAKPVKDSKNGVTRPNSGVTRLVWDTADRLSLEKSDGTAIERAPLVKALEGKVEVGTIHTQYGRWRKYYGLTETKGERQARLKAIRDKKDADKAAKKAEKEQAAKAAAEAAKVAAEQPAEQPAA